MVFHFIWFALIILGVFGLGIVMGIKIEIDAFENLIGYSSHIKNERTIIKGMWLAPLCITIWFGFLFGISYIDVRDEFIDKYKNNKIIEQVSYKYDIIDDKKVLTDSTFVYKRK